LCANNRETENNVRKLIVYNTVSLDGYFADIDGKLDWAHKADPQWQAFVSENARDGGELVFGRVTYELMASFWPTPLAAQSNPTVAERMNSLPKVVFSRTLDKVSWSNTRLMNGDLAAEVRKLKREAGPNMVIMGSGSIVAQLAESGLIDEYQIVANPTVLGKGRTLFDGVKTRLRLKLKNSRAFDNGNVVLFYQPIA
jgi:dihydrofolate reductase